MENNNRKLHAKIEELQKESDLKTGWISLISHDLKENFSSLLYVIEAVENETINKEDFFKLLPQIKDNAKKNLQTVTDTGEWLRTQYGDFKPQTSSIFIYKLFLQLKQENESKLSKKSIDFKFKGDKNSIIDTDHFLISFILNKILDNAVKYSHPGQNIHFEVKREKKYIKISIIDFGMGMSPESLASLYTFEAPVFHGTNDETGAGLSLKIVNNFVDLLSGKIEIKSLQNEETKVSISLPRFEK